jgi:hypothetical protein
LQQQTSKLESDTAANNIVETLKTTLAATTYVDEQNSNLTSRLDKIDVSLNSIDGNINTIAPSLNKNDEHSIIVSIEYGVKIGNKTEITTVSVKL